METNFIYRDKYRGGAINKEEKKKTTLEYFQNTRGSDYIFCLRGGGNFSIRLYETLMMGRIPIFVDTDCILPFPDQINWRKHVVWIKWDERHKISTILKGFHDRLSDHDFEQMQLNNRKLWSKILQPKWILTQLGK